MPLKKRRMVRELQCKLSDAEIRDYALRNSQLVVDLVRLQDDKKATVSDFNARIKDQSNEIEKLSRAASTGIETRSVECEERIDHDAGWVVTVRLDTMEEIARRSILGEETQVALEDYDGDWKGSQNADHD